MVKSGPYSGSLLSLDQVSDYEVKGRSWREDLRTVALKGETSFTLCYHKLLSWCYP